MPPLLVASVLCVVLAATAPFVFHVLHVGQGRRLLSPEAMLPQAGLLTSGGRHASLSLPSSMLNDQMPATKHAISMSRLLQGWTWELIDIDGVTAATGVAADQKAAMGMARRAAESFPGSTPKEFPDIVVGR